MIVESPVPPRATDSWPTHEGEKVWMSPAETIESAIFVSVEVAKV